jgi:hypothetical protein
MTGTIQRSVWGESALDEEQALHLTPFLRLKPLTKVLFRLLSTGFPGLANNILCWWSVIGGEALRLCL